MFSMATTPQQAGLVDIRERVADIDLDIRYAGNDNFTGAPVDGYRHPRCYLLAPAADALAAVESELRAQGLRLRIFDCYRPVRAVRRFMRWVEEDADPAIRTRYHPNLPKSALRGEYIAPLSGHSRGATVDLTLLECDRDRACRPLDMGTPFDFFDPRANTDSPQVTAEQRANRDRLRAAMERHGFRNYPQEWWHYTLDPEPSPRTYHDVPVE
ncbi:M15 family metallopeptidase [Lysobacter sp. TLK-CK17T]|uniref:D-alanyl-D-alanine dipeptidase n=2 Tax=Marilutibacter chinensis TaxID=2912247 RepID=A0ABS9HW73_9GAMM|nr:M15 family metallopeptidase [Lysobacter chinensis]MCF7223131.1 M15 family metallopeptidase [Lysobacter chinensis]